MPLKFVAKYLFHYQDMNISEAVLSKIDKSRQPNLKRLNLYSSPISGRLLFDLKKNIGWHKVYSIQLSGDKTDDESNNIGFRNICEYKFSRLLILHIRKKQLI